MGLTANFALKEWAVAIEALCQGRTIILLRKGGLRERQGKFEVKRDRIWLYPTYEHQKPELLKPEYAARVQPVPSGWHPETIQIQAWAQIDTIFQTAEASTVLALLPYHIWNERFVHQRLGWKPGQPLYVLLLRVYQLKQACAFPYCAEYGGCRSWIELLEMPAAFTGSPVIDRIAYDQQVEAIGQILR